MPKRAKTLDARLSAKKELAEQKAELLRPATQHVGFVDVFDWTESTISFTIDRTILFEPTYDQSLLQMLRAVPEKRERRFERIQLSTEAQKAPAA